MKFKNYSNSDNFFSRLLIYITIEAVLIIAIVSSALYYIFRNTQLSDIYSNSKDNLSQVSYSTNFMVDSAKSLLVQMYYDNTLSKLRYNTNLEPTDVIYAVNLIGTYAASMPFVDSIYFYNGKSDTFYTNRTNGAVESGRFFDKDIINILKDPSSINISKPIARKIPISDADLNFNQTTSVFTFIYCDNCTNIDSAIILNVSELWVRKVINALDLENNNNIFIIDSRGQILSSIYSNVIQSNVSTKSFYNHIKIQNKPSGHFIDDFDGKKSLFTYVSTEGLDWKFIRVIPYSKVTEMLTKVTHIIITICLALLCVGLIISFHVSRKVYKPIDAVIKKLNAQAIEYKKSSKPLKEDFLRSFILNRIPFKIETFKVNAVDYNIKIDIENDVSMILLKIDHFLDFTSKYNYEDRSILKYGIMNIAYELLGAKYNTEVVDIANDHIVAIFNENALLSHETSKSLDNLLIDIQNSVFKYLGLSLSCILGPRDLNISQIVMLYNDTLYISNYKTFYGTQCIIHYDQILNDREYIYPIDIEKSLIDSLLLSKIQDVKKLYDTIISDEFLHCQYSQFNSTLLRLAFSISTAVETIERVQNLNIDFNFSAFIGEFNNLETLSDIRTHFFNMFDTISIKLEQKKIFKHDDLINRIIDIINENYTNVNLCLDGIADSVNMSPVYLGRLFKKNTLKSVSDYINDMRMEKAATLLSSTDMTINDIVEKVGFLNRSYFCTVFKKNYGSTPSDYRRNLSKSTQ